MSEHEFLALAAMSMIAGIVSMLALIDLLPSRWPRRNRIQRWKRQLLREWERNPLPAPRADLIIKSGAVW